MKRVFDVVKTNPLFQGIALGDFENMLSCMSARTVFYPRGELLLMTGDTISSVGFILSGAVKIIREDVDGNISILTELSVSECFGEVYACAGISQSPVTIQATEDTEILAIDYRRIVNSCSSACPFHTRLIENMLRLLAQKNLMLHQKDEILSKRTTRAKLICFFDFERGAARKFSIPFSREELAHYLCVDRSAMSGELGRMRNEGLIKFDKNKFEVLY